MKRLAILLATVITAQAAPVELAVSTNGSGIIEQAGVAARISKANLVLKRDGKFTLGLVGGDDFRITGRWQPAERDDVALRITGAFDKDANGAGSVDIRARRDGTFEVSKITLTGVTSRGVSVGARFTADRPLIAPPPKAPVAIVDAERTGRGAFRTGGQRPVPIRKVHLVLYDNKRVHLHTEGGAELKFEGTWADGGQDTVTLNVKGGINGERLTGAARTRNGRVGRVELNGTVNGQFYSVEFDPLD